jgi:hypothetical protein
MAKRKKKTIILHNADCDVRVEITPLGKRVITLDEPVIPAVPYLICGMNYDEAEKYCEHVSQSCDGTTGYCAKDEVEGG